MTICDILEILDGATLVSVIRYVPPTYERESLFEGRLRDIPIIFKDDIVLNVFATDFNNMSILIAYK